MNWHRFGPWGGYSYNRDLIPNAEKLVKELETKHNLHIGLNYHDCDGVFIIIMIINKLFRKFTNSI